MPESDRFNGCLDEIRVEFVERKATPKLLMRLGIQLGPTDLLLLNTIPIFEIIGVSRARSTVHN